jgi:hypothetical protein
MKETGKVLKPRMYLPQSKTTLARKQEAVTSDVAVL